MEQTLGKRIVQNRKRLGLTQDALAEKLGVTAQAVSKWENDQSCPDITMLPKLAEIFGTTTDVLLGVAEEIPVRESTVVQKEEEGNEGIHFRNGNWEFKYDNSKRTNLLLAVALLLIGVLYLASTIFVWDVGFWDIAWPSFLLVFGLFGLYPKFSFFRLGVALLGGYFLADHLFTIPFALDGGAVIAVVLLFFGGSLLVDTLRKPKKPKFSFQMKDHSNAAPTQEFCIDEDYFAFNGSFGEQYQDVSMDRLAKADINVSFGDYTLDLAEVKTVSEDCEIDANSSFGQLTIMVPSRYQVRCASSASFASVDISGHPDPAPVGTILLSANASFGEICVKYI